MSSSTERVPRLANDEAYDIMMENSQRVPHTGSRIARRQRELEICSEKNGNLASDLFIHQRDKGARGFIEILLMPRRQ